MIVYNSGTKPLGFQAGSQPVVLKLGKNERVPIPEFVVALKKRGSALLRAFEAGALRLDGDRWPLQVKPPRKVHDDSPDLVVDPTKPAAPVETQPLHTTQRPCPEMERFLIQHGVIDPPAPFEVPPPAAARHRPPQTEPAAVLVETEPVSEPTAIALEDMDRSSLREFLTSADVEFDGRASKAKLLELAQAVK